MKQENKTLSESDFKEIETLKKLAIGVIEDMNWKDCRELSLFFMPPPLAPLLMKLQLALFFADQHESDWKNFLEEDQWACWKEKIMMKHNGQGYLGF